MKTLMPTDTIVCDTARLNYYINCGKFDYDSELDNEAPSLFEKIMNAIEQWVNDFFRDLFDVKDAMFTSNSNMRYMWLTIGAIVLIAIAIVIIKKKMFFFKKKNKVEDDYQVVEDSIYGIDFEHDISIALKSHNYKEAVRLKYLQCLKMLSDGEHIDWRLYKTPAQYTGEFPHADFHSLTQRYVLVRYGDYAASATTYEELNNLYESIKSHLKDIPVMPSQKGGGENED